MSNEHRQEWRQFRLLSRDATRRLLNAALFSRDADPAGFAIWMLALVATPPAFYAMNRMLAYVTLRHAPLAVVERTVLGDRLFFVTYGMLAAVLLASLMWEALFPDRAEQEIVGVLPVRPRTLAAARLSAALHLGTLFACAVSVPPAIIYTMAAASYPALRSIHTLFVGHVVGTLGGCLFVFLALLCARGAIAATMGTQAGRWIATLLQLVSIVMLVESMFFLPGVVDVLVRAAQGGRAAVYLPPVWFAALFSWLGGDAWMGAEHLASIRLPAALALTSIAGSTLAVAPLYLLSARRVGRQLMETRERHGVQRLTLLASALAGAARRQPRVRSLFVFGVASLTRSRQHSLILSAYLGLAIAVSVISLVAKDFDEGALTLARPSAPLLALPLVLIFFLVFGLSASFRVPVDVGANWPFRLLPPSAGECAEAAWLGLLALGVLPVACATLVAGGDRLWPFGTALAAASLSLASGLMLIELVSIGWTLVPFACAHVPTTETLKWKWIAFLAALNLFAFQLASLQALALQSSNGVMAYIAGMIGAAGVGRALRHRSLRRRETTFEDTRDAGMETLGLSEALR